jgi:hypothetical protein
LISILTVRSDVDVVHVAGVGVGDESIVGARDDQLVYSGPKGMFIRLVARWVRLTREKDGFRDTYPGEGVRRGCRS